MITISVILTILLQVTIQDSVCDKTTLQNELKQDLRDNQRLDCTRWNPPPHFKVEDAKAKNLRLAAQWESDCAFEADSWKDDMNEMFGVSLITNTYGDAMEQDSDLEADMCEFIRSIVAEGKIPDTGELNELKTEWVSAINCLGFPTQTQPCAVNDRSYFSEKAWTIFFNGSAMGFADQSKWTSSVKPEKKEKKEDDEKDEDQQETDEEKAKRIESYNIVSSSDSMKSDKNPSDKQGVDVFEIPHEGEYEIINQKLGNFQLDLKKQHVLQISKIQLNVAADKKGAYCMSYIEAQSTNEDPLPMVQSDEYTEKKDQNTMQLYNYQITPKVEEEYASKIMFQCKVFSRVNIDHEYTEIRSISLTMNEATPLITKNSDPDGWMKNVSQGDAWEDSGLEVEYNLQEFKKWDLKAIDKYTKQPVLFLYTVSGQFQGQLEFYVFHQLMGSYQKKDKHVGAISYGIQNASSRGSFMGFDFGEFKIDDERMKKYLVKLKYRYTGGFDFSSNGLQGKLSVFPLPQFYLAEKAQFDQWTVGNEQGDPYTKKFDQWQDIFGWQKYFNLDTGVIKQHFKYASVNKFNILFIYNVVFDVTVKEFYSVAIRLTYFKGGKFVPLPGSTSLSNVSGNKRHASGITELITDDQELKIQFQMLVVKNDNVNIDDVEQKSDFIDKQQADIGKVKKDDTEFSMYEKDKVGCVGARLEIFATASDKD